MDGSRGGGGEVGEPKTMSDVLEFPPKKNVVQSIPGHVEDRPGKVRVVSSKKNGCDPVVCMCFD